MTVLGYSIDFPDDGTAMLPDENAGLVCPKCGSIVARSYINPKYVPRKKADVLGTDDSFTIVSAKFKAFCQSQNYRGLKFSPLAATPHYYVFQINPMVQLISDEVKFEDYCSVCKQYGSVYGLMSIRLQGSSIPLKSGVYRSDIEFGYRHLKFPLIIVGIETRNLLVAKRMKGLTFEAVCGGIECK